MPNLTSGTFVSNSGALNCAFGGTSATVSGGDIIGCTFYSTTINLSTPSNAGIIAGLTIGAAGNDVTLNQGSAQTTATSFVTNSSTRTITINGNIDGATTGNTIKVDNTSSGHFIINGYVVGGYSGTTIRNNSTGTITVNGMLLEESSIWLWYYYKRNRQCNN